MEIRKNDTIIVRIQDMTDTGEGIGKTDGFTWFIKDAVTGDRVEAGVMKAKKSYGYARLTRVLEPSPARVEPLCPAARSCGGCQLQAMSYEEQLRLKEQKVFNNLVRIGGFRNLTKQTDRELTDTVRSNDADKNACTAAFYPIIGMETPWRYRNKALFPFGMDKSGRIITGFYAGRTHNIIEQEDCLLGVKENAGILAVIRRHMEDYHILPYDEKTRRGLVRHALIRKGFRTGELMVCLVINGRKFPAADTLVSELLKTEGMTSISLSVNTNDTNVIMGKEIINLFGPGYINDWIGNIRYRISPLSFYQVNPVQTEKLYGTALEYAELTGNETVWDLYCGIGTISLFLAQRAKKVYGVEIIPEAIADARENARQNGLANAEFFVGKAEEVLPEQYEKNHIRADVIVVDPPRKGCDPRCLETILKMAPERIVYVSCDSATLARDLRVLCDGGYELRKVRPCDMFGETIHVETVVSLTLKRGQQFPLLEQAE